MMLYAKPNPSIEDASYIAESLRVQEVAEGDVIGLSPADSCLKGIRQSEYVFTLHTEDDTPIALIGIVDHNSDPNTGIVWSMSTKSVSQCPLAFVKAVMKLMEDYGGMYDRMISLVASDNPQHLKFPKVLGMAPTGEKIEIPGTGVYYDVFELMTAKGLNKIYYEQS